MKDLTKEELKILWSLLEDYQQSGDMTNYTYKELEKIKDKIGKSEK